MRRFTVVLLALGATAAVAIPNPAPPPRRVVRAAVESSLPTAKGNIRQFAFDGNESTHFESARDASKDDHLTLSFDEPVNVRAVEVIAGRPGAKTDAEALVIEYSADGTKFSTVWAVSGSVMAVRFRATKDLKQPLVVREVTIDSTPKVVTFRYPVEFALDVTDAPEMKAWGEKVVRVCEREYPDICAFLASPGYTPPTFIPMALKSDYNGVAEVSGARIKGSVKYFTKNPNDVGAMVHETVHCVQQYKGRNTPGWLVEGIADYVRFWRFEPGKAGRLQPERAKYDGSYRTTAAFLAFVTERYDRRAVPKLNAMCREGRYTPEVWRTLTGKSVEELNQEWRQSLAR